MGNSIRPGEVITIPSPIKHTTTTTLKRKHSQCGHQNAAGKRGKASEPNIEITLETHLDRTHSSSMANKAWIETPYLLKILEGFLSITGVLHTDAIHVPTHLRWWTPHEADTKLGASQGSVVAFLTNNSTWINLATDPHDDSQNIQRACLAASIGEDWTRTVILVRRGNELLNLLAQEKKADAQHLVRTHILADIPEGVIDLYAVTPPPARGTFQKKNQKQERNTPPNPTYRI